MRIVIRQVALLKMYILTAFLASSHTKFRHVAGRCTNLNLLCPHNSKWPIPLFSHISGDGGFTGAKHCMPVSSSPPFCRLGKDMFHIFIGSCIKKGALITFRILWPFKGIPKLKKPQKHFAHHAAPYTCSHLHPFSHLHSCGHLHPHATIYAPCSHLHPMQPFTPHAAIYTPCSHLHSLLAFSTPCSHLVPPASYIHTASHSPMQDLTLPTSSVSFTQRKAPRSPKALDIKQTYVD